MKKATILDIRKANCKLKLCRHLLNGQRAYWIGLEGSERLVTAETAIEMFMRGELK